MPSLAARTVLVASLMILTACGLDTGTAADTGTGTESTSTTPASPRSSPSAPHAESAKARPRRSTAADMRLVRDFVSFAAHPSPQTAVRLPLADEVALGLGRNLRVTLERSDVSDSSAWVLRARSFRAVTGPFNALERIQRHAEGSRSDTVGGRGAFRVSVGAHPHCASPPVPAQAGLRDHRRVSVPPSASSIDSCLSWFTVDLFVDEQGNVAAVTLDVWEP